MYKNNHINDHTPDAPHSSFIFILASSISLATYGKWRGRGLRIRACFASREHPTETALMSFARANTGTYI